MDKIRQSAGKNLAWISGFLEGDGSIRLNKQRMSKERILYSPSINFTNTDHLLIEKCAEILKELEIGFYIQEKKTKNGIAKTLTVKGFKRVKKFLPYIINEMYGKKKIQAEYLLEWLNSREITGNNNTYTENEIWLYNEISNLKRPDYPQRLHARPQIG